MKTILTSIAMFIAAAGVCGAQAVVKMSLQQNPLFEVSTNAVNIAAGDSSVGLTLGGDVVVRGGSGNYSYRWYTATEPSLGIESTITVYKPGIYLLDITDTCDCLQTVEFNITFAGVAIVDGRQTPVLSPNPTFGPVNIAGFNAVQVAVVGMSGRVECVVDRNGLPIDNFDIGMLPAGQYIVTLSDSEGHVSVARLIKK